MRSIRSSTRCPSHSMSSATGMESSASADSGPVSPLTPARAANARRASLTLSRNCSSTVRSRVNWRLPSGPGLGRSSAALDRVERDHLLAHEVVVYERLPIGFGFLLGGVEIGTREEALRRGVVAVGLQEERAQLRQQHREQCDLALEQREYEFVVGPPLESIHRCHLFVALERRPEAVRVQSSDVAFALLTSPGAHHRLAFVVNLQHEFRRVRANSRTASGTRRRRSASCSRGRPKR